MNAHRGARLQRERERESERERERESTAWQVVHGRLYGGWISLSDRPGFVKQTDGPPGIMF